MQEPARWHIVVSGLPTEAEMIAALTDMPPLGVYLGPMGLDTERFAADLLARLESRRV